MSFASPSSRRLASVTRPSTLRSLLEVVNDNTRRNHLAAFSAAPAKPPAAQPQVDFEEVSRVLQLARKTLREEQERILGLKERIVRLRGFEDAYFKGQETIAELRADRDMWRKQAVAMSNRLLSNEPL